MNPAVQRPWPDCPLVVAYGLGVNSTAMLVEFAHRSIRPDLILFADTGGEKPETYQYLDVIRPFLARVGFPDVIVVRYRPTWAVYDTLEQQCLHTGTLPSLAYGGKSCSWKHKRNGELGIMRSFALGPLRPLRPAMELSALCQSDSNHAKMSGSERHRPAHPSSWPTPQFSRAFHFIVRSISM
jgi:hypothetical protein